MDFAFILGRDPKPFPPPMKLCKEMVEAMGGAERYTDSLFITCHLYVVVHMLYRVDDKNADSS